MRTISTKVLFGLLMLVLACTGIRDWRETGHFYGSDLRNRVVGARMTSDGRSPYFYTWRPADGVRYYDPDNDAAPGATNVSVNTATPFFHRLMGPLAEWPQIKIFRCWLGLEYLAVVWMAVFFFRRAGSRAQKIAVVAGALLFMLTSGWSNHLQYGQYYVFIPFLATLFYQLTAYKKSLFAAFAAGLVAITVVLFRPNSLLLLLPYLALYRSYSLKWLAFMAIPVLTIVGWTALDGKEWKYWQDYRAAISEHMALHVQMRPFVVVKDQPSMMSWEGVSPDQMKARNVPMLNNEHGNFFIVLRTRFHLIVDLFTLHLLSLAAMAALVGLFLWRRKTGIRQGDPVIQLALLGYALYMISDLFSPVFRYQYYSAQWIFPVLLAGSCYHRRHLALYGCLFTGLVLNIINIDAIGFEHTAGEYLMLAALIGLSTSSDLVQERV